MGSSAPESSLEGNVDGAPATADPSGMPAPAGTPTDPSQLVGPVSELPDGTQLVGPLANIPDSDEQAQATGQITGPVVGVALTLIAVGVFIAITGVSLAMRRSAQQGGA
jgi:hypothetical protein